MSHTADIVGQRLKHYGGAYFAGYNSVLLEHYRQDLEEADQLRALSQASGIKDEHVLHHLLSLGVSAETAIDIGLIPLVFVAWADGFVDLKERQAVLDAAQEFGIEPDSLAHRLLAEWLQKRPDTAMLADWIDYIREVVSRLPPEARQAVRRDVIERARRVARAAGGVFGVGTVCPAEEEVLRRVLTTFREADDLSAAC